MIDGLKTIFWFRDPADSLHSYFQIMRRFRPDSEFGNFLRQAVPLWENLATMALAKARLEPASICLVRYEDYVANPVPTFQRISDFCGLAVERETSAAVRDVNKNFQSQSSFVPTEAQPQRGVIGLSATTMDAAKRDMVQMRLLPLYKTLSDLTESRR